MKAVWLASWYPNRTSITNGDFIERHAKATAPFLTSLTVITAVKDESLPINTTEIVTAREGNIITHIIYYSRSRWKGSLEKVFSYRKYIRLQMELFNKIVAQDGLPDVVHVHVAMKAGLVALKIKKQFRIPFIITEHWTGYNAASQPNIFEQGPLFTRLCKKIFNEAALVLPVSADLGKSITDNVTAVEYTVLPNVVDTGQFYYKAAATKPFRFLHASYMHFQKNPEGILQACRLLRQKNIPFEILMVGAQNDELRNAAEKMGLLNGTVFFEPAVSYETVATKMQSSHALLLFSRFENMPCVILEALCCGLPVISTHVGGVAEVINNTNGILVNNEDVQGLANAMQQMITEYDKYNRVQIAEHATAAFNYSRIGSEIKNIYDKVVFFYNNSDRTVFKK